MDFETVLPIVARPTLDPCVYCDESTAPGSGRFANRIDVSDLENGIDGWGCGECAGYECDRCGDQIYVDSEVRVYFSDLRDEGDYLNVHEACATQDERDAYKNG